MFLQPYKYCHVTATPFAAGWYVMPHVAPGHGPNEPTISQSMGWSSFHLTTAGCGSGGMPEAGWQPSGSCAVVMSSHIRNM